MKKASHRLKTLTPREQKAALYGAKVRSILPLLRDKLKNQSRDLSWIINYADVFELLRDVDCTVVAFPKTREGKRYILAIAWDMLHEASENTIAEKAVRWIEEAQSDGRLPLSEDRFVLSE